MNTIWNYILNLVSRLRCAFAPKVSQLVEDIAYRLSANPDDFLVLMRNDNGVMVLTFSLKEKSTKDYVSAYTICLTTEEIWIETDWFIDSEIVLNGEEKVVMHCAIDQWIAKVN